MKTSGDLTVRGIVCRRVVLCPNQYTFFVFLCFSFDPGLGSSLYPGLESSRDPGLGSSLDPDSDPVVTPDSDSVLTPDSDPLLTQDSDPLLTPDSDPLLNPDRMLSWSWTRIFPWPKKISPIQCESKCHLDLLYSCTGQKAMQSKLLPWPVSLIPPCLSIYRCVCLSNYLSACVFVICGMQYTKSPYIHYIAFFCPHFRNGKCWKHGRRWVLRQICLIFYLKRIS